jgi:hypothetical protein
MLWDWKLLKYNKYHFYFAGMLAFFNVLEILRGDYSMAKFNHIDVTYKTL